LTSSTDAVGTVTNYTNDACNGLLNTKTTIGTIATSQTWDCNGGVVASSTDANGNVTSFKYQDPFWRLTSIQYPDHGETDVGYHPLASPPNITTTQFIDSTNSANNLKHQTNFDGVGQAIQDILTSDPAGNDIIDKTYDGLGRVVSVSNPHRTASSPTDGITTSVYDALGRVKQVNYQDQSVSSTDFSNYPVVITTDPTGKLRGTVTDGLGRLVEVDEPTGGPVQAHNYATLQSDSNFVLYNQAGAARWQSRTAGTNAPNIYMQDDGNLVLYSLRWMAGTYTAPVAGSYPQSTCSIGTYLTPGEFLPSGKCITSPHGEYFLLMNTDGNLFIYDWVRATGTWGPGTQGHPGAYALFQTDGNFVVWDVSGTTVLWQSGTSGTNAERLDLLDDGRLMIWKSVWSTQTSDGQFNGTVIAHPSCDAGQGTGWTGVLGSGQCFVSPNGRFELLMQDDANLVIYDRSVTPNLAIWSTATTVSPVDPSVAMRTLYSYDALGNMYCVEQHGSAATGTACPTAPPAPTDPPVQPDPNNAWRRRLFAYD
jgi:hypothetical protein